MGPQKLVLIHYLRIAADGPIKTGLGNRMVACTPKSRTLPQSSGSRPDVTCPACRASEFFTADDLAGVSNHVPVIEQRTGAKQGTN